MKDTSGPSCFKYETGMEVDALILKQIKGVLV